MLEFRLSTFLKAIVMLALILGGCEYLSKTDKLKVQLAELQSLAISNRETADVRTQEWNKLKNARDKSDQASKSESLAMKKSDALGQRERKLEGEIKYLAASMTTTVEKVRTAAIGIMIKELKLPDGGTLKNAKILKIEDSSISFLHEDGVANLKVKTEELPKEFVEQYDLGLNSLTKRLQRLDHDMTDTKKQQ